MSEKTLAEQAAEKRREYKRAWNAKNRDKCREHTQRYWERKVLQEQEGKANDTSSDREKR
ncbi:MAG: hypothetical protein LBL35_04715 [Clostridiales bacterium]|nr:hypothetical protein [Clostridiales bacterium]